MQTANNILLVRVPAQEAVDGRELRDYILESLAQGVLVLTEDASCEVMELPPLGGVEVSWEQMEPEAPAGPLGMIDMSSYTSEDADESPPVEIAAGRNKEEKLAILERLREYRRAHGLGCWNGVAKKAGGNITPELIRDMLLGKESPSIADWRKIDRAVQSLDKKSGPHAEDHHRSGRPAGAGHRRQGSPGYGGGAVRRHPGDLRGRSAAGADEAARLKDEGHEGYGLLDNRRQTSWRNSRKSLSPGRWW